MLEKEKFYRITLIKKKYFFLLILFLNLILSSYSYANLKEKLFNEYKNVNSLYFDFTQKIGDKIEFGSCYIKYPLRMNCEYPKKNKNIITNGKKFAIVKKRYKKIYYYPLKKTPLFYLLNKDNILNIIQTYELNLEDANIIQYEISDNSSNRVKIFFNKKSLKLAGWQTIDAYSNEVSFLLRNVKVNVSIDEKIFKIPKEEDL